MKHFTNIIQYFLIYRKENTQFGKNAFNTEKYNGNSQWDTAKKKKITTCNAFYSNSRLYLMFERGLHYN